jgi:hypothetical protein
VRGRHVRRAPRRVAVPRRTAVAVVLALAVGSLVAVVALLAVASAPRRALQLSWSVGTPLSVVELPVARCPTSFGAPRSRDVDLPAHVTTEVSASMARSLSVFTDGLDTLGVVAPTSWSCTALDSVAGSSTLIVYPPGDPTPVWGHVASVSQGIVASQTGSCGGCSLEIACPLFPEARHEYRAAYRVACAGVVSRREQHVMVSSHRILFIDPPGVLGAGKPSGGGDAAYGAMLWHLRGVRGQTAWLDTCTLPAADRELCVQSVRAFLARHPG